MTTNALPSQGIILQIDTVAAPGTFINIAESVDIVGPDGQANIIDATHHGSVARDKLMGLPDEGQVTFSGNLVVADTGQVAARVARDDQTLIAFKILLPDAPVNTEIQFSGFVLQFALAAPTDDKITLNLTIEISGPVTWFTPP